MTSDPLYFLKESTSSITANPNSYNTVSIHPLNFFLSTIFVLVLIYLTVFLLKVFMKKNSFSNSYLLKEININQSLKILYLNINKKIYITASTGSQLLLLDTIKNSEEIIQLLSEQEEVSKMKPFDLKNFFNFKKKPNDLPSNFEHTLKSIIKDSENLENINKK